MSKKVRLLKNGARLRIEPITEDPVERELVAALCAPALTYKSKRQLMGAERRKIGRPFVIETYEQFAIDTAGRLITNAGFYDSLHTLLRANGYQPYFDEFDPLDDAPLTPDWHRLYDPWRKLKFRHRQEETLAILASRISQHLHSCVDAPPGFGKTFLIACLAIIYYTAKIHIATKRIAVAQNRMLPELGGLIPNVGMIGGKRRDLNNRVTIVSFDSLHHSKYDANILIIDEVHEAAADKASSMLSRYDRSINIGFSASHDMRADGKDPRVEAMCGPIVISIPYQEAEANDMVVPIRIHWTSVQGFDPVGDTENEDVDFVEMKRLSIWLNDQRNDAIADVANTYDADTQVLIVTETLQHAMQLKKRLPHFELVYAAGGLDDKDRARYIAQGCIDHNEPEMTKERKDFLTQMFERGKLKKAIATTVWNVGVSFNSLAVMVRADGGGSDTMDIQLPGRVSRTAGGKQYGVVHDFLDQFSQNLSRRAKKRHKNYESQGWRQILPPGVTIRGQHAAPDASGPPRRVTRKSGDDPDQQNLF